MTWEPARLLQKEKNGRPRGQPSYSTAPSRRYFVRKKSRLHFPRTRLLGWSEEATSNSHPG